MTREPALHTVPCAHGRMTWREAGAGPALVLLHGIGSGSGAWSAQLAGFASTHRVIAWDAPGYGDSHPLADPRPLAKDYACVLADWLARLGVSELSLVGHSLGALMAAAWAAHPSARLRRLVLASPARGYGRQPAEEQQRLWQERAEAIARLGPQGLADARAARLCSPQASAEAVALVRAQMARATVAGYGQAAHMLAHDDLLRHLAHVKAPITVLCGTLDAVTPPAACQAVAEAVNAPFVALPGLGHACYVEGPLLFNSALAEVLTHD